MKAVYKLSLGLLLAVSVSGAYAAAPVCDPGANVIETIDHSLSNLKFSTASDSVSVAEPGDSVCIGASFPNTLTGSWNGTSFKISLAQPSGSTFNGEAIKYVLAVVQSYKVPDPQTLGFIVPQGSSQAIVVDSYSD